MGWASVMKSKPITLHRFLSAYHEPLIDTFARLAGEALAAVPGAKTIDAFVMSRASLRGDIVFTSDFEDLERLRKFCPGVCVLSV